MRSLWLALVLSLCASNSMAHAQVRAGTFKLSLDTDVLSYQSAKSDVKGVTTSGHQLSFGPGSSALRNDIPGYLGLSVGYVATPHVIPQLRASFGHNSGKEKSDGDGNRSYEYPTVNTLTLQPMIEVPLNPDSAVVGFVLGGFDYRHVGMKEHETPISTVSFNAYGPVVGAGLHLFVIPAASLDLGAQFSYLFARSKREFKDNQFGDSSTADSTAAVFLLTAGLTLWP